jgi:hypothetical protein
MNRRRFAMIDARCLPRPAVELVFLPTAVLGLL